MGTMRHDRKIKNLFLKFGLEGYGLYNLILESITEKLCNEKPDPDLEENSKEIASYYNADTTKINEMTCWMISEGLLELNEVSARIECKKIYKYLEQNQTRSEKIRSLISLYKKNTIKQLGFNESKTVSDICDRTEENRIEENRTDKIIYSNEFFSIKDSLHKELLNKYKDIDLNEEYISIENWLKNTKKGKARAGEITDWNRFIKNWFKNTVKFNNNFNIHKEPEKKQVEELNNPVMEWDEEWYKNEKKS